MSNELVVTPTATPRPRPEADGSAAPVLTDHAFFMRTGKRRTWQGLTVADRDAIPALRPTAGAVLAGQTVVDAFTAYRMADGTIAVFRPDSHIKRLNNGARRLALPQVDFDRVWTSVRVPSSRRCSGSGRGSRAGPRRTGRRCPGRWPRSAGA